MPYLVEGDVHKPTMYMFFGAFSFEIVPWLPIEIVATGGQEMTISRHSTTYKQAHQLSGKTVS